jgi:hypothetical protein
MKNMFLLLSILFFITGCSEEKTEQQNNSIYGTWQLIERFDGGSPTPNQIVENGEIIVFSSDNSYSNNTYQCDGNYNINNSIIEISVLCITTDLIKYSFSIENNELKLTSFPSTCDEGCYDKYKRILSE